MIEGLKIRVTSGELRTHLLARSVHHRQRADEKEAGIPELKSALETVTKNSLNPPSVGAMNKMATSSYHLDPDDAISQVETDIRNHRNSALAFEFFADHLFDEDYTLSEADLRRLEILR